MMNSKSSTDYIFKMLKATQQELEHLYCLKASTSRDVGLDLKIKLAVTGLCFKMIERCMVEEADVNTLKEPLVSLLKVLDKVLPGYDLKFVAEDLLQV
jgi:hypothetical protein